jgi:hypothetical protein
MSSIARRENRLEQQPKASFSMNSLSQLPRINYAAIFGKRLSFIPFLSDKRHAKFAYFLSLTIPIKIRTMLALALNSHKFGKRHLFCHFFALQFEKDEEHQSFCEG